MDVIELIYRLKRAGHTQVSLARELGVTRGVVNDVIHDRKSAFRVAKCIAEIVGADIDALWPGRYRQGLPTQHHPMSQRPQQKENLGQK
ncbi:helix-turn-helix domain-containing protein [Pusillimonas noertemannii]|uniref:helix-turn-helix domain-containing protein n=1 Tax=Pusillimonas noertemannii TaxID=305977 RepID=UPI0012FE1B6D|nr:helix-turn-helix domain-containing protein [Pusillimonas noertemannii]